MLSAKAVADAMSQRYRTQVVHDGLVKGERVFNDAPYAVTYVDLSQRLAESPEELTRFQEELFGPTFFDIRSELRWNSYLYFVVESEWRNRPDFSRAKALIESDRNFARKFVVSEEELPARLGLQKVQDQNVGAIAPDVMTQWQKLLGAADLTTLLELSPRTKTLDKIAAGTIFSSVSPPEPAAATSSEEVKIGRIEDIYVDFFRPKIAKKRFRFGDVNLIFGPNGTGKTSLLEAIEALHCGRTRRDAANSSFKLVATVRRPNGAMTTIDDRPAVALLKARNLLWYGRPDFQSTTITEGFSRFNFLDTDAAFRLSAELDPDDVKNALNRLLIGPEAAKAWDYLSKLGDDVRDRVHLLATQLETQQQKSQQLDAEIKRSEATPTESRRALDEYLSAFSAIKPKWGTDDNVSEFAQDKQRFASISDFLATTLSLIPITPLTQGSLREYASRVSAASVCAKDYKEAADTRRETLKTIDERTGKRKSGLQALQSWVSLQDTGAISVLASIRRLREAQTRLSTNLKGLALPSDFQLPAGYVAHVPFVALPLAEAAIQSIAQEQEALTAAIRARRQLEQSVAALKRELADIATRVIESTGERALCPVCLTEHAPGELHQKVENLSRLLPTSPAETDTDAIAKIFPALATARMASQGIAVLKTYCERVNDERMTSGEALDALNRDFEELRALTVELNAQEERGRIVAVNTSMADVDRLSRDLVQRFPELDYTDMSKGREHLAHLEREVSADENAAKTLREEIEGYLLQSRQLADQPDLQVTGEQTIDTLVIHFERLERAIDVANRAIAEVEKLVDISDVQGFETLKQTVDKAAVALEALLASQAAESAARNNLTVLKTERDKANESVAGFKRQELHFMRVHAVLLRLTEEYSLSKATEDSFRSIEAKVASIFGNIHSPCEYKVRGFSDTELLVSLLDNTGRTLEQVSTGQRAAFALSVFLALNSSAENAPPVVLIDDPVAHIDDLNALSFLDYLRDFVLDNGRQLFFATADSRLAALFQKKFNYLGTDRFKVIEPEKILAEVLPAGGNPANFPS